MNMVNSQKKFSKRPLALAAAVMFGITLPAIAAAPGDALGPPFGVFAETAPQ